MANSCQCGEPSTLMVRVLKDAEATHSEFSIATCGRHAVDAVLEAEKFRELKGGVVVVRSDVQDPHKLAWWLVKNCKWVLHAPEILILLALAGEHAEGSEWVSDAALALRRQCSPQNARESVNRPRINAPEYPMVKHSERKSRDGKTRTYHKLSGWNE